VHPAPVHTRTVPLYDHWMIEPADVRRRLVQRIEVVRREAAARRTAVSEAEREYERFLEECGVPVFRMVAAALRPEGAAFQVFTPAGSVRLASERSRDDFIELGLDTSRQPVEVVGRTSVTRGSRLLTDEQPVRAGARVRDLTDEDVVEFVLRVIGPFVER
jgi:hypothetical protein